jgi:hypothetical protein
MLVLPVCRLLFALVATRQSLASIGIARHGATSIGVLTSIGLLSSLIDFKAVHHSSIHRKLFRLASTDSNGNRSDTVSEQQLRLREIIKMWPKLQIMGSVVYTAFDARALRHAAHDSSRLLVSCLPRFKTNASECIFSQGQDIKGF